MHARHEVHLLKNVLVLISRYIFCSDVLAPASEKIIQETVFRSTQPNHSIARNRWIKYSYVFVRTCPRRVNIPVVVVE